MAASPSLYVMNMEDSVIISNRKSLTMPALSEEEALAIAAMIGVAEDVVKTYFSYMNGITRYLFEPRNAELKVKEAVNQVDTTAIMRMVSMQATSKAVERVMVHSLVLWKADTYDGTPQFELVSGYAKGQVAKKLAVETAAKLKEARQSMAPLSGAEGYAGALFEAYAIRTLQAGGTFAVRSLSGKTSFSLKSQRLLSSRRIRFHLRTFPTKTSISLMAPALLWLLSSGPPQPTFPLLTVSIFTRMVKLILYKLKLP